MEVEKFELSKEVGMKMDVGSFQKGLGRTEHLQEMKGSSDVMEF